MVEAVVVCVENEAEAVTATAARIQENAYSRRSSTSYPVFAWREVLIFPRRARHLSIEATLISVSIETKRKINFLINLSADLSSYLGIRSLYSTGIVLSLLKTTHPGHVRSHFCTFVDSIQNLHWFRQPVPNTHTDTVLGPCRLTGVR